MIVWKPTAWHDPEKFELQKKKMYIKGIMIYLYQNNLGKGLISIADT
jgi:hypothetical protein